jgi:hypothetical protein
MSTMPMAMTEGAGFKQGVAAQVGASQEPTKDAPQTDSPQQAQKAKQISERAKKNLLELRRRFKNDWAETRRRNIRKISKAIEFFKGNQIVSFNPENNEWFNPIEEAINEANLNGAPSIDLGQYVDNIYQMLTFSFIAALSPNVPKTRFWPADADDEKDLKTANAASSIQAQVERQNNIKGLQKNELLHHFTGGAYFTYNRWLRDSDRCGSKKVPVYQMRPGQIMPDRWICESCGHVTKDNEYMSLLAAPACEACGSAFRPADFHEAVEGEVPQQVDVQEVPNGQMVMTVYGGLNVDAAPYANELFDTPLLDLEDEIDIASLRGSFPGAWDLFKKVPVNSNDTDASDLARVARKQVSESYGRHSILSDRRITYSRCWIQSWAFNALDTKEEADELHGLFPTGCLLMSVGGEDFLDAREERLTDHWTWCPTVKGLGLYPPAVGDPAISVQERINDVANIVHEHMDRNGSPTILADEEAIDTDAMAGKPMPAGSITGVKRKNREPLSSVLFQPTLHVDANIYNYSQSLVMLAQLMTGILPQIFGGSDPNVRTAQGQQQMLNTALGRLGLFWDNIREEHAQRAKLSVKIVAENMTEDMRHVVEDDGAESGFANEIVHIDEVQGEVNAYPESDQGFPMTYAEMRDRMEKMLFQGAKNPLIQAMLDDPTNQKLMAMYVGPPGMVVPGDAERAKLKQILDRLANEQPFDGVSPLDGVTPMILPSILPDKDFDDMEMLKDVARQWGQKHWEMAEMNPEGYENVRAYLRLGAAYAAQQQVAGSMVSPPAAAALVTAS